MRFHDDREVKYPLPCGPRLAVRLLDESARYDGMFLPESVMVNEPDRGVVVSVGPGYRTHDGYVPLEYEPGDEVMFFRERGVPVEIDGQHLLVLREEHVLVVVSPAPGWGG